MKSDAQLLHEQFEAMRSTFDACGAMLAGYEASAKSQFVERQPNSAVIPLTWRNRLLLIRIAFSFKKVARFRV